jgi:hypothetical protein
MMLAIPENRRAVYIAIYPAVNISQKYQFPGGVRRV